MNNVRLLDESLDALDRLLPELCWTIGDYAAAACLLEASAPKAGNVHPAARFDDMDYDDFRRSARIIGEVIDSGEHASCGELILAAAKATQDKIGKNTNLGIILLLSPMIVAVRRLVGRTSLSVSSLTDKDVRPTSRTVWRASLSSTLASLSARDSFMVYQAITMAKPGGLGTVEKLDVRASPPDDLMTAMRAAAAWDDIANQYATEFSDVFALSERLDTLRCKEPDGWFHALCRLQVEWLAEHGDSLIARKNNPSSVDDVKRLAASVLKSLSRNDMDIIHQSEWNQLDDFLRSDGHRRNPGTTADLLAAAVFVSLLGASDPT